MSTGVSTKERLISHFEAIDGILKDILDRVTKKAKFDEYEHLVRLLLDKDSEIKRTLKNAEEQLEIQKKIDKLRADCVNSDAQIELCQKELKKSELLLSTALYYCRQKLDCMVNSIKNPIDLDELIQFSHWISFNYGVMAPDNWVQGDPRRPYPSKKEIRRGYLGHLDDSGHFRPSVNEEFAQAFPSSTNTPASSHPTPGCPGTNTAQSGATPAGHPLHTTTNQGGFPTAQTQGPNVEQPVTYSPGIMLPGVNMVSSPSAPSVPNGSQGWNTSILSGDGSNSNAGNSSLSPVAPAQQPRHANSLAAMLGGQSGMSRQGGIAPPGLSPLPRIPQQPCGPLLSGRLSSSPSPATITSSRQQSTLSGRNSGSRPGVQLGAMFSDSHTPCKLHRRKRQHLEPGSGNESMEKLHTESSESSDEDFKRRNEHTSF